MPIIPDVCPTAHIPPAVDVERLRVAIINMAARYGQATQQHAYALGAHADERALHIRAMRRRFAAIQRLTRALADFAGGAR